MPDVLDKVIAQRRDAGIPLQPLYRSDAWWFVCRTCRKRHELRTNDERHVEQYWLDWLFKHPAERGCTAAYFSPDEVERLARRTERKRKAQGKGILHYAHNADVKEAFQGSNQNVDLTSLNSLASSATAGWGSHYIDNSSLLYLDYVGYLLLAAVNTAPGSNKALYVWPATSLDTTNRPTTGAASSATMSSSSSTSGTLTYPSIATPLACLLGSPWVVPYPVQNAPLEYSFSFSTRKIVQLYAWFGLLNYSGFTIAASGNALTYRGLYNTVT